jgi:hypothetical protein
VGGDAQLPAVGDEGSGVVALVGGDGAAAGPARQTGEQLDGGGPLGVAVGLGEFGVDDQGVAVLHEQVAA